MVARQLRGKHEEISRFELEALAKLDAKGIAWNAQSARPVARAQRLLAMLEGMTATVVLRVLEALDDKVLVEVPVIGEDGRMVPELRMVPRNPEHMRWACQTVLDRVLGKPRQQVTAEVGVTIDLKQDHLAALERLAAAPRVIEHSDPESPSAALLGPANGIPGLSDLDDVSFPELAESEPRQLGANIPADPQPDDDPY